VKAGPSRRGGTPWRAKSPGEHRTCGRPKQPGAGERILAGSKTLKARMLPGPPAFSAWCVRCFGAGRTRAPLRRREKRAVRLVPQRGRFGGSRDGAELATLLQLGASARGEGSDVACSSDSSFGFGRKLGRGARVAYGWIQRHEGTGAGDGVRLREERKALKGDNPMSGSGMKQGQQARGGSRRREVEKT
jgi:hypothetical protein